MIRLSLFLILVVLNWIDYDTTRIMVLRDGFIAEANPVNFWAMQLAGSVVGILFIKIAALTLCAVTWKQWKYHWITLVIGLYSIICFMNILTVGGY